MAPLVKKKVLLMGRSGSGKTSMRSVIFQNALPSLTHRLGATIDVEQSHQRFLGSLVLNLWDCGGQRSFLESYLSAQRSTVFAHVGVLIYVFDVDSAESDWLDDLSYFRECLKALNAYSPEASKFVLLHKMDLVNPLERAAVFQQKRQTLSKYTLETKINRTFGTSIWDESLYKAWSQIVHTLVPNATALKRGLTTLTKACGAVEAVLFERTTFLLIAHSEGLRTTTDENLLSASSSPTSTEGSSMSFTPGSSASVESNGTASTNGVGATDAGGVNPSSLQSPVDSAETTNGAITAETTGNASDAVNANSANDAAQTTANATAVTVKVIDSTAEKLRIQHLSRLPGNRFERISSLLKTFKLTCGSWTNEQWRGLHMQLPQFTAVIEPLTVNSYVMVLCADPWITPEAIKINIRMARQKFEDLQAGAV